MGWSLKSAPYTLHGSTRSEAPRIDAAILNSAGRLFRLARFIFSACALLHP